MADRLDDLTPSAVQQSQITSPGAQNGHVKDPDPFLDKEASIGSIVAFSIQRQPNDLPPPKPCPICGGVTELTEFPYRLYGDRTVLECERVPAYECEQCGAGLLDPGTLSEIMTSAADALQDYPLEINRRQELRDTAGELRREAEATESVQTASFR